MRRGRNDPEDAALSRQNDQGPSLPSRTIGAFRGLTEATPRVDAPGSAGGRSRSWTGERLTRRHQRAERSPVRRDDDGGGAEDPFDRWVDRQLRSLYGPVADEPIPPRLRELLEQTGRAVDAADDGDDDGDGTDGHGPTGQDGGADGHGRNGGDETDEDKS